MSDFRDYIPADEDPGPFTDKGFTDFVPEPKPQPQTVNEEEGPIVNISSDAPVIVTQTEIKEDPGKLEPVEETPVEESQWDNQVFNQDDAADQEVKEIK